MKVYDGVLEVMPSRIELHVGNKTVTLPLVFKNGQFIPYRTSSTVKEVYAYDRLVGISDDAVLYFPSLKEELGVFVRIREVRVGISRKLDDKKELRAYETPQATTDLFVLTWLNKLKNSIEEVLGVRGEYLLAKEIEGLPIEKFYAYLKENWERLKPALKGVLDERPRFVVFDPQAGSGEALFRSCEKYGIDDPVLLGVELREIQQDHPGYKVQTGTDYMAYYSVLFSEFSRKDTGRLEFVPDSKRVPWAQEIASKHGLSYRGLLEAYAAIPRLINPPYIAQGNHPIVGTTFASEPPVVIFQDGRNYRYYTGGWGFVVSSAFYKNLLDRNYKFLTRKELSHSEVGYENPVPEKYIIGVVCSNIHSNIERELSDAFTYLRKISLVSKAVPALEEFVAETARRARELMIQFENMDLKEMLSPISFEKAAKRGEKVFPAIDLIGGEGISFYSYEEVKNNPILLALYKEKMPYIYEVIERMAKERKESLFELSTSEYRLMGSEGLGILKYAGLPLIYKLEDVKEKLMGLLPEEEREIFERLVRKLNESGEELEVWVKSGYGALSFEDGTVGFGRRSYVCLCNGMGQVHAILPVDPLAFLSSVNEIKIRTYQEKEDFIEVVEQIIRKYAEWTERGVKELLSETELKLIESYGRFDAGLFELSDGIYIRQKLSGRFIKDRIIRQSFFDELAVSLNSLLNGMGEKPDGIRSVLELVEHLRKAHNKNFVFFLSNFDEVKEKSFADMYTDGKPLVEWLRDRVESIGLSEDAKREVYSLMVDEIYSYQKQVLERDPLILRKAIAQYMVSKELRRLLQEGKVKEAYELFRFHLSEHLGAFPYQIDFALNSAYAAHVEGKNILLGWQQRTGKTRAAIMALVFLSFLKDRTADFLVRSQNLLDIMGQYIDTFPALTPFMRIVAGQARTEGMDSSFVAYVPYPDGAFPNPFYRGADLFIRKGTAVKDLLEQNAYAKIEHYMKNPDPELLNFAKGRIYEQILDAPGYSKEALMGVVCYLAELDKRGELNLKNIEAWKRFIDTVYRDGERIEQDRRELAERPVLINLHARETTIPSISYMTVLGKKYLTKNVTANVDIGLRETASYMSDYYVLTPYLIDHMIARDRFEEFQDLMTFAGMIAGREVYIVHQKDIAPILDYLKEMNIEGMKKVELITLSHFYEVLAAFASKFTSAKYFLEERGFPVTENASGYLELPEPVPYIEIDKKNNKVTRYIPDDLNGFLRAEVRLGRGLSVNYIYDPEKNGKFILRSARTNARSTMIKQEYFQIVAGDELEGKLEGGIRKRGQDQQISATTECFKSFSSNGATVIQMSGTSSVTGEILTKSPLDETYQRMFIVNSIIEMSGVKDDMHKGFFEHLVNFLSVMSRYGAKDVIEDVVFTIADGKLSYADRIEYIKKVFQREGFYEPHMEEAFEVALSIAKKISKDDISSTRAILKNVFDSIEFEVKKLNAYDYSTLLRIVQSALTSAGITRKLPTYDPVLLAYIGATDHDVEKTFGNISSFTGRRSTMVKLKDQEEYIDLYLKGYKKEKRWRPNYQEIGKLKILQGDKDVIGAIWPKDVSIDSIRKAYDMVLPEIREYRELYDDFEKIVNAFQEVFENAGIEHVFRSSKTTQDSLSELVLGYVRDREINTRNEEKKRLVKEFLKAFKDIKVEKTEIVVESSQSEVKEKSYIYTLKMEFLGKKWEVEIYPHELKGSKNLEERIKFMYHSIVEKDWNILIDVSAGRGWVPEIFKNKDTTTPMKFSPIFGDIEPVVDVISNRAFVEEYARAVSKGESVFIPTDRVATYMVVLGDLISSAYKNKTKEQKVSILALITDRRIKEFIERIDKEFLARHGIYLEDVYSSSELSIRASKLREQGRQVFVVANMTAIARGTDLSMLDYIIPAGRIAGNEGQQVLSRTENPLKQADTEVFLGIGGSIRYRGQLLPDNTIFVNINALNRRNMEEIKHTGNSLNVKEYGKIVPLSQKAEKIYEEEIKKEAGLRHTVRKAISM